MLSTWLAAEDLADLCGCAFAVPKLGNTIVYGVSANEDVWWDNSHAAFLGWQPRHSASKWAAEILASTEPEDPAEPASIHQGGAFVSFPHPDNKS